MFNKLVIGGIIASAFAVQLSAGQTVPLAANDKDFIAFAGETDLVAAGYGELARQRAVSEEVRQFGQMLNEDHTDNLKRLTAIAIKTGASVPDTLDVKRMKALQNLRKTKAKSFDHQYLKSVVNDHESALESFKQEADHSSSQDLVAYAKDTLPKLEQHLKEAKQLAASVK